MYTGGKKQIFFPQFPDEQIPYRMWWIWDDMSYRIFVNDFWISEPEYRIFFLSLWLGRFFIMRNDLFLRTFLCVFCIGIVKMVMLLDYEFRHKFNVLNSPVSGDSRFFYIESRKIFKKSGLRNIFSSILILVTCLSINIKSLKSILGSF